MGIRSKNIESLHRQVSDTSESLGENLESPNFSYEESLRMTEEELKNKFPKRYEIYVKGLKHQKRAAKIEGAEKELMINWLEALNNIGLYIKDHMEKEEGRTLRDKQFEVVLALQQFLEEGNTKGYIKLPTGVGKTVIFVELIEALKMKSVVVVPKTFLLHQTGEKIDKFAPGTDYSVFYGKSKRLSEDVTMTTYDSLPNLSTKIADVKLLILDEAHRATSEKRTEVIEGFESMLKIGFTATPDFSDEKKVGNILPKEIFRLDIKEAVQAGLLSDFSCVIATIDTDLSGVKIVGSGPNAEYNQQQLAKAVNVEKRNRAALEIYQQLFANDKGVIYCVGIDHAKKVTELFTQNGVAADFITGADNDNEKRRKIADFETGKIKILCNADLLIEGFDEPSANLCINLRPTFSQVVAEQRGGRVLRLDPSNPDKHAYIVDFIDKNTKAQVKPISFAEIAEGAFTQIKGASFTSTSSGGETGAHSLQIKGLKVIVDVEQVIKYVRQRQLERVGGKGEVPLGWATFEELVSVSGKSEKFVQNILEFFRLRSSTLHHKLIDQQDYFDSFVAQKVLEDYKEPEQGWHTLPEVAAYSEMIYEYGQIRIQPYDIESYINKNLDSLRIYLSKSDPENLEKYYSEGFREYFFKKSEGERVRMKKIKVDNEKKDQAALKKIKKYELQPAVLTVHEIDWLLEDKKEIQAVLDELKAQRQIDFTQKYIFGREVEVLGPEAISKLMHKMYERNPDKVPEKYIIVEEALKYILGMRPKFPQEPTIEELQAAIEQLESKQPQQIWKTLKNGQILATYIHFHALKELKKLLLNKFVTE